MISDKIKFRTDLLKLIDKSRFSEVQNEEIHMPDHSISETDELFLITQSEMR